MARMLPVPADALRGQNAPELSLPESIVCFYHHSALLMNQPPEGRALHHRYVLMLALETAVTVCVDDRAFRLEAGHGLLVLPFQFHNYVQPEKDALTWLFITFEMADGRMLEPMRDRPFELAPPMGQLVRDFLRSYLSPTRPELTVLNLALLLARIREALPAVEPRETKPTLSDLVIKINSLAQGDGKMPSVEEMASSIGISASHLRARFRASCGVTLGKHLRRLRMEKAAGLLRTGNQRISEIAEHCGFNSVFSFSRAFHQRYGMSPMAYRQSGRSPRPAAADEEDRLHSAAS